MLRSLASLFLNPLLHFFCMLLLAAFFFWRGRHKLTIWVSGYALFWLLLVSVSPLPGLLSLQQEARFELLELERLTHSRDQPVNVLVLGAGHSNAPGFRIYDRLSEPALKRLLEGVRIKKQLTNAKLICSGYSNSGGQSQAGALAEMALTLGVSPQDTMLQPFAVNTEAEAAAYSQRFKAEVPLILVTSALHMPRAMFWFQYYGLNPIPAPTNHLVMPDPEHDSFAWKPSLHKLKMTQKLLHEYAGMAYAKWKTW